MDSYVLFRNNRRLNLREDDLSASKIGRIFQVCLIECVRACVHAMEDPLRPFAADYWFLETKI